jgi:diaminobutyrate-2-oxoglutarate transaminase
VFSQKLELESAEDSSHAMYSFVRKRESSARTYANTFDRVFQRGYLARLFDTTGREYLDCLSCAGTLATGHNHPYVMSRVREFLDSGHILQGLDMTTPAKHAFLEELLRCLPAALSAHARVQFCGPTGADAVEAAIKLFKTATGRRSIWAFHGAYHGMTSGALSLTGNVEAKQSVPGAMPDVHFLPYPYPYRCPFGLGGAATSEISLNYIERLLKNPHHGVTKPAAIVVEAVQGEGGVIPAPREWLKGLRRITQELDIPLVLDEVQTGFGRTGDMFAIDSAGVVPDAMLLSKAIGGGFPLSLLVYHERYDRWTPGAHAGTFRGNQIAMAAGVATLELIRREGLVGAAAQKGEELGRRLREIARTRPCIGDVRGRGLMWGLELVHPSASPDRVGSLPPNGELARAVRRACFEHGLIVETGGFAGSVLRLLPPLVISWAEIDEMLSKLTAAIDSVCG